MADNSPDGTTWRPSVSVILPAAIYDYDRQGWRHLRLRHLNMELKILQIDEELDWCHCGYYASKEFSGLSSKFAAKDR
jgi:hypothetical protein